MTAPLAITRVINACVLLELGGDAVLTDPYFTNHWFMRFREPIGLTAHQLPRLSAILGGHSVFNHWQPSSLAPYEFKQTTPVFVVPPLPELAALFKSEARVWRGCGNVYCELHTPELAQSKPAGKVPAIGSRR